MAADEILRSYGDVSIKEDVLDLISNLSPTEDSLFRTLGKSKAYDTVHSWLVDTLDSNAAAANEQAEFSALASSTPSRSTNVVEIINKDFAVTDVQRAVAHYGMADQYAYQQMKAMKDWRNKAESEVLRGSLVSGASGTTPQMAKLHTQACNVISSVLKWCNEQKKKMSLLRRWLHVSYRSEVMPKMLSV